MKINKKDFCKKCIHFLAHDVYGYLGLCTKKDLLTVSSSDKPCENFKEVNLRELEKIFLEKGWLYCLTCKKPIYSFEELKNHLTDQIGSDFLSDEVASEEAPSAD